MAAAVLACAAAAPRSPGTLRIALPDLSTDLEDRFPRGGRPTDAVSGAVFERINRDRRDHGLSSVAWDERAAAVARRTTRRQVEERTDGHFLLDGLPPYARLSAGAVFGMGAENAAAFISDTGRLHDGAESLALRSHAAMMEERPPHDSHRRAVLDAAATHVGIGWAMDGGEFRLGVEFTARAYESLRVRRAGRGAAITVDGTAIAGEAIRYVTVSREAVPSPISRREANARESYSYPEAQVMILPEGSRERAVGIRSVRTLSESATGNFFFPWEFDAPGLWTFTLYFHGKRPGAPQPGGAVTVLVTAER